MPLLVNKSIDLRDKIYQIFIDQFDKDLSGDEKKIL